MPQVLLIDDDDLIAGSLQQFLLAHGCDVDVAADRVAAEKRMDGCAYLVVVADPYLTGEGHRDAPSLVTAIRDRQPSAKIFLVTAYGSPELTRIAREHEVHAVVDKPQSVLALSKLVFDALPPAVRD